MQEISIRAATEEDLPAILALYSAAEISDDMNFTIVEARKQFAVFAQYPFFRLYVAVLAGRVVGTYELLIMDNLAKRGRKSGIVEDVAVDPGYQRLGIGRRMMEHAREICRAEQCYKLTLSSNVIREDAHRFYDSLGFERHGYSFHTRL
jgi:ribosomal protein S18 acetylase RimI-like enzyme